MLRMNILQIDEGRLLGHSDMIRVIWILFFRTSKPEVGTPKNITSLSTHVDM